MPCTHTTVSCQSERACLHQTVNTVQKLVKLPIQKGQHSWKCTELSFKRKKGIAYTVANIKITRLHDLSTVHCLNEFEPT